MKEGRPRFAARPGDVERLLLAIGSAVQTDTVDGLVAMLAEDIELVSDGGGKVIAALRVLAGPAEVAAFLIHIARKPGASGWRFAPTRVNGGAGVLISTESGLDSVMSIELDPAGRVAGIYLVRNPDKLVHLAGV